MALPGCDLFIKSEKYDPIRIVTFALLYNKLSKSLNSPSHNEKIDYNQLYLSRLDKKISKI